MCSIAGLPPPRWFLDPTITAAEPISLSWRLTIHPLSHLPLVRSGCWLPLCQLRHLSSEELNSSPAQHSFDDLGRMQYSFDSSPCIGNACYLLWHSHLIHPSPIPSNSLDQPHSHVRFSPDFYKHRALLGWQLLSCRHHTSSQVFHAFSSDWTSFHLFTPHPLL